MENNLQITMLLAFCTLHYRNSNFSFAVLSQNNLGQNSYDKCKFANANDKILVETNINLHLSKKSSDLHFF